MLGGGFGVKVGWLVWLGLVKVLFSSYTLGLGGFEWVGPFVLFCFILFCFVVLICVGSCFSSCWCVPYNECVCVCTCVCACVCARTHVCVCVCVCVRVCVRAFACMDAYAYVFRSTMYPPPKISQWTGGSTFCLMPPTLWGSTAPRVSPPHPWAKLQNAT